MRTGIRNLAIAIAATALVAASVGHASAAQTHNPAAVRQPAIILPPIQPTNVPPIHPTFMALPDLTIGLAALYGCTWATFADGDVWVDPLIEAYGTGFNIPAHVLYWMTSNYDSHAAGGQLTVNSAQTWGIDIGPAASLPALGHVLKLTLTVDWNNAVAESNESNNVGTITIDLTHVTSPPGISFVPIACY
jgi:hypothetical protein